ncbi:hypothetical protein EV361DRAFT_870968 [Lentinula raphanica]|nr:hypothetical protein EV361DRAFT_870968 [Lentinula raphanica]
MVLEAGTSWLKNPCWITLYGVSYFAATFISERDRHRTIYDSNSTSTKKDSMLSEWWDVDALTSSKSCSTLSAYDFFESGIDEQSLLAQFGRAGALNFPHLSNKTRENGEFMYRNSILTSKNWTDLLGEFDPPDDVGFAISLAGAGRGTSIVIPAYNKGLKITISSRSSRALLLRALLQCLLQQEVGKELSSFTKAKPRSVLSYQEVAQRWGATISPSQVPAQMLLTFRRDDFCLLSADTSTDFPKDDMNISQKKGIFSRATRTARSRNIE